MCAAVVLGLQLSDMLRHPHAKCVHADTFQRPAHPSCLEPTTTSHACCVCRPAGAMPCTDGSVNLISCRLGTSRDCHDDSASAARRLACCDPGNASTPTPAWHPHRRNLYCTIRLLGPTHHSHLAEISGGAIEQHSSAPQHSQSASSPPTSARQPRTTHRTSPFFPSSPGRRNASGAQPGRSERGRGGRCGMGRGGHGPCCCCCTLRERCSGWREWRGSGGGGVPGQQRGTDTGRQVGGCVDARRLPALAQQEGAFLAWHPLHPFRTPKQLVDG